LFGCGRFSLLQVVPDVDGRQAPECDPRSRSAGLDVGMEWMGWMEWMDGAGGAFEPSKMIASTDSTERFFGRFGVTGRRIAGQYKTGCSDLGDS